MSGVGKFVIWVCYAAAVAYIGYSWYTYSGLFRLAVEWQLANFQSYSLKMTLLALTVALIAPVAIVARLKGGPDLPTETRLIQALKAPSVAALLGLVLLAASAGAGWLGYQKSQEIITYESVDLSAGQTPSSNHVVLTGIAHIEYLVQFETKRGGSTNTDNYFPLASSAWRRGEPFVYFVKTKDMAYLPQGGGQPVIFFGRTPPFRMTTEKALLVPNGLPGPVGEAFRKSITVANPPIVLDLNPNADFEMYWIGAIACGLLGFGLLLTSAVMASRRRRVPLA